MGSRQNQRHGRHTAACASLIIPIHNGEEYLSDLFSALSLEATPDLRIVLSLNGCRDGSRSLCGAFSGQLSSSGVDVRVIETDRGSRVAALNAAEAVATGHRLYVDQDALLEPGAILAVIKAFNEGVHFATGTLRSRSPAGLVRMAYRSWSALDYVQRSPSSAGFYAVSEVGRSRWGAFPDDLPDDKFARLHFQPCERLLLPNASYSVVGAVSMAELIRARRRYQESSWRLSQRRPDLGVNDLPRRIGALAVLIHPSLWLGTAALFASDLLGRISAR